jgi:putative FmdB family regulatory protein
MPIFDFECSDCGNKFDLLIANKDKNKVQCPTCESRNVKQLLSVFATTSSSSSVPQNSCQGCPSAGSGGCAMRF